MHQWPCLKAIGKINATVWKKAKKLKKQGVTYHLLWALDAARLNVKHLRNRKPAALVLDVVFKKIKHVLGMIMQQRTWISYGNGYISEDKNQARTGS